MEDDRNKSRRERLTRQSQLPRLDLTGQNTGAQRRSPARPASPGRNAVTSPAAPTAPAEIDPRVVQTRNAVGGALNQALEVSDAALGDVAALGVRANAAATGGLGRLIGLAAPEVGSDFLASADRQRAAADTVARRGLFTEGTFTGDFSAQNPPATPQTPRRGQAQAQPAPAVQPEARPQEEADVRSALSQRLPGFSLNGQQPSNVTNLPFDTGASEGGNSPSFVVERRGTQAPTLARLGEAQADGRRRVLPTTFEFGGQTFTPAQAEALGPVLAQQINAQGNVDAANIRASQPQQIDTREQAGQQIITTARARLQSELQNPEATPESRQAAVDEFEEVLRFLFQRGQSSAQELAELQARFGIQ